MARGAHPDEISVVSGDLPAALSGPERGVCDAPALREARDSRRGRS
jgi:hypothetical protein